MSKIKRSRVVGSLAAHADGFRSELAGLGYTPASAELQVWLMGRLSRWLAEENLEPSELDPSRVAQFLATHEEDRNRVPTERSLVPLLGYLRSLGVAPEPSPTPLTPVEELVGQYRRWLVGQRDLAARTVGRYLAAARRFLEERASAAGGGHGAEDLTGADVTGFLLRECTRLSVGSAKGRVAELRSLLRFLYLEGVTSTALAVAVPPVAGWHDTTLPVRLAPAQVTALLES
jgi:hypothetical protein